MIPARQNPSKNLSVLNIVTFTDSATVSPKMRILLALERTGMPAEAAVMVGDRMYTDIAAGANAGIDTAFVLSGEGTIADAAAGPPPTWIFDGIAALHRAWETARRQREEESAR